jgi:hypothetical protein
MNDTTPITEYRLREALAGVERRIAALERTTSTRGRFGWVAPTLAVVALLATAMLAGRMSDTYRLGTVAPVLQASEVVLKDENGVQRAALGVQNQGQTTLTLSDPNGRARLRLSVLPDGSPGVSLLDTDGQNRAILGLLEDGTTTLVFADRGAVARGVFALTPDGAARMIFSDQRGVTRAAVGVGADGTPEVSTIEVADGESAGGQ